MKPDHADGLVAHDGQQALVAKARGQSSDTTEREENAGRVCSQNAPSSKALRFITALPSPGDRVEGAEKASGGPVVHESIEGGGLIR